MEKVNQYDLNELSHGDSINQVMIKTDKSTVINITQAKDRTVISFNRGEKFDIIDGNIIIHNR